MPGTPIKDLCNGCCVGALFGGVTLGVAKLMGASIGLAGGIGSCVGLTAMACITDTSHCNGSSQAEQGHTNHSTNTDKNTAAPHNNAKLYQQGKHEGPRQANPDKNLVITSEPDASARPLLPK